MTESRVVGGMHSAKTRPNVLLLKRACAKN